MSSPRATFPVVYPELNASGNRTHLEVNLDINDVRYLRSVAADQAFPSHLCQLIIKHAAAYARTHRLTFADRDEFYKLLCERSFAPLTATEAAPSHVTGRDTEAGERVEDVADLAAGSRSRTSRGSRGKGSKK